MSYYEKYSHKKVVLSDVLDATKEYHDAIYDAIRALKDSDPDKKAWILVGKLQSAERVLDKLEAKFGVQDD